MAVCSRFISAFFFSTSNANINLLLMNFSRILPPNLPCAQKEKLTEPVKSLSEHSSSFIDLTCAIMHTENHHLSSRQWEAVVTGGCRWHLKLVQAIFVILSFISFSVHLLFFLHALFLECKFFWTELLLILLNITALSGCLCVFFFLCLELLVTMYALSWTQISPILNVLRSLFTNSYKIKKWEINFKTSIYYW